MTWLAVFVAGAIIYVWPTWPGVLFAALVGLGIASNS